MSVQLGRLKRGQGCGARVLGAGVVVSDEGVMRGYGVAWRTFSIAPAAFGAKCGRRFGPLHKNSQLAATSIDIFSPHPTHQPSLTLARYATPNSLFVFNEKPPRIRVTLFALPLPKYDLLRCFSAFFFFFFSIIQVFFFLRFHPIFWNSFLLLLAV